MRCACGRIFSQSDLEIKTMTWLKTKIHYSGISRSLRPHMGNQWAPANGMKRLSLCDASIQTSLCRQQACQGKYQTHLRSLSQVHVTATHKEDNLFINFKPPASSSALQGQVMCWSLIRCLGPCGLNKSVKCEREAAKTGKMRKLLAIFTL